VCDAAQPSDLFFQGGAFAPKNKLLRGENALDGIANFVANDRELRR
jgi:hypothetical protein